MKSDSEQLEGIITKNSYTNNLNFNLIDSVSTYPMENHSISNISSKSIKSNKSPSKFDLKR